MKLLLDTHLIIWSAATPSKLPSKARRLIENNANALVFSVVSIWEVAIKRDLVKLHPGLDPGRLRDALFRNGYEELSVNGLHALAAGSLPLLHKDPFDRMLVAQASVENLLLVTSDREVSRYPGPIQLV